jgi:hypothetical protein
VRRARRQATTTPTKAHTKIKKEEEVRRDAEQVVGWALVLLTCAYQVKKILDTRAAGRSGASCCVTELILNTNFCVHPQGDRSNRK